MKARRIFSSKTVIFIWSILALFFFTTQISIFNITSRVDEKKVPFKAQKNIAAKIQAQIFFKDAKINHSEDLITCSIPKDPLFPLCEFKIQEFHTKWNQNCHGEKYKVDPKNICSVIQYLSEREAWCPVLPWRSSHHSLDVSNGPPKKATIQTDLSGLLDKFKGERFTWIRNRILGTWQHWMRAVGELQLKPNFCERKQKKILLYLAAMGEHKFFLDGAFLGGPLGELVQWCDLISALYILGHDLTVGFQVGDIPSSLVNPASDGCVRETLTDGLDLIFTDIMGVFIIAERSGPDYSLHKCKMRVLDSFGTDAEFNYKHYKGKIPGGRSPWGDIDLQLPQFLTMYPHSPDNSFLGFAVPQRAKKDKEPLQKTKTRKAALVYGKDPQFWEGHGDYINAVKTYFNEVHATLGGTEESRKKFRVPEYVINHGIVNITTLIDLLDSSKVFVGLGQPYEGPAALEALANGCFFINPKITSQNPYAEVFVGKPFVQTVDIHNLTEVEEALKEIISTEKEPHLPYEFTHVGMLERINAYVENQDFCKPSRWPPLSELKMTLGGVGESCLETCLKKKLICEPQFFVSLNTKATLLVRAGFECGSVESLESLVAPSLNTTNNICLLQSQPLLFSCRAARPGVIRVCPCRSYRVEQVALCETC
ncbi:alpha-1,6-mannosylglycoprotein 6-beta-N-acetylglucosaminyltransferase A-like isoform X3 [Porites lutea]|uniref:alpha-1,6-mannosylglycoprotein 6-beta-N-acetylglucosaminyltransferase A-like isoform X3 n=1 Tax=Porites lutea TaxID=51062 RepID=UPI003CC6C848